MEASEESVRGKVAQGSLTTVVGVFPTNISAGANIIARGSWHTHPKFGLQFRAQTVSETRPTTAEAIERYLSAGAVKGLGPVLASRIVEHFGEETLEIFDQHPERLKDVPGIGAQKLEEITRTWKEKKDEREVHLFFHKHGISNALASRIFRAYGLRAIDVVTQNPYVLARDIWGVGFQTADRIARALGVDADSPERLRAGLAYVLKRGSDDGHCLLPREQLLARSSSLLDVADERLLRDAVSDAALRGDLIENGEDIYLPPLFGAECQLAEMIVGRLRSRDDSLQQIAPDLIERACVQTIQLFSAAQLSGTPSVGALSSEQQDAIRLAATRSMMVLTGGPGCGKTTVLRTLAQLFRRSGLNVKLAAPTGRAAQRLSEVCGIEASTIHRLLKYDPAERNFVHDKDNPLPVEVLIVDESSMIDIPLAASLMRAVPRSARIIFVGDADQLPSVGPGLFLGDMLECAEIPRVRLTKLFRRDDESSITKFAHDINAAIVPDIPEPDGITKSDAYFIPARQIEEAAELVERLVVEQIPKKFGYRGNDITVLTPMNQGELGVIALNERLQKKLIPDVPGLPKLEASIQFRLGDRVVQRVNNYTLTQGGVFNGDQGEVVGIDAENNALFVQLWDGREVEYPSHVLYQLDLGYALTIHRSQGSEVPVVVLALHDSHHILLERQLLYTAVTRAKKLLIVVGSKRALALATKRTRSKRRYTNLAARLRESLQ